MNELRTFTGVDKHEAVKIGDVANNSEAIKVVGADFNNVQKTTDPHTLFPSSPSPLPTHPMPTPSSAHRPS